MKIDQQLKHNDCGISAVKIIYDLYNIEVNRSYVEENINLSSGGSSLVAIKSFLDKEYFETQLNLIDANTAKFNAQYLKDYFPCILPVKNNQRPHYVVIRGMSGKKLQILDPGKGESYKWSFSELMNNAIMASSSYEWVGNKQIIAKIISEELSVYNISYTEAAQLDQAEVMNKLTYFTYVKENFGFKNREAESTFLTDLLFNQQINTLPKQFRNLKLQQDKLKIQAPVVLTVKKSKDINYSSADKPSVENSVNPYRRLFIELNQHHNLWYIYIISALFAAFLTQLTVFSNQILIDEVLPDFDINLLILFAVGLAVFKLFDLGLSFFKDYIAIHLSNILDNYFLTSFINKLNNFPIRYIHSYSKGDLTERIKDSLKLKNFFVSFFTSIIIDAFVCLFAISVMLIIDWQITMIIVGILLLFFIWFKIVTPYIRENEKKRFLEKSSLFSSVFENIDGLQVIKSFGLENSFKKRLVPRINNILDIQKKVRFVGLINSSVIDVIIICADILIIVLLSSRAINNGDISIGQIITFIALSHEVLGSLSGILSQNLDLQENQIILSRYFDFGKEDTKKTVVLSQSRIKDFTIDSVSFQSISFFYNPEDPIFTDVNFVISKGEKIRLKGNNGTGKSTFCKILSLLYPQNSGSILINGEKQVFYNDTMLRKKILLVSNEDILFNDTLGYNMTFKSNNVDTLAILTLAKEIGLYEFIGDKDEGLEYVISEQGRNLSTGQRKKILLMRALLSDAELLIFDETLSGIDTESKEKIEEYINSQTGRSFIVISHEPLMNLNFNKTFIIQHGKIEQQYNQVA